MLPVTNSENEFELNVSKLVNEAIDRKLKLDLLNSLYEDICVKKPTSLTDIVEANYWNRGRYMIEKDVNDTQALLLQIKNGILSILIKNNLLINNTYAFRFVYTEEGLGFVEEQILISLIGYSLFRTISDQQNDIKCNIEFNNGSEYYNITF